MTTATEELKKELERRGGQYFFPRDALGGHKFVAIRDGRLVAGGYITGFTGVEHSMSEEEASYYLQKIRKRCKSCTEYDYDNYNGEWYCNRETRIYEKVEE